MSQLRYNTIVSRNSCTDVWNMVIKWDRFIKQNTQIVQNAKSKRKTNAKLLLTTKDHPSSFWAGFYHCFPYDRCRWPVIDQQFRFRTDFLCVTKLSKPTQQFSILMYRMIRVCCYDGLPGFWGTREFDHLFLRSKGYYFKQIRGTRDISLIATISVMPPIVNNMPTKIPLFNPFTHKSDLIDFTLSNARRFYSSKGDPLGVKGLRFWT